MNSGKANKVGERFISLYIIVIVILILLAAAMVMVVKVVVSYLGGNSLSSSWS